MQPRSDGQTRLGILDYHSSGGGKNEKATHTFRPSNNSTRAKQRVKVHAGWIIARIMRILLFFFLRKKVLERAKDERKNRGKTLEGRAGISWS